jgi:hypothetical protein
MRLCPRGAAPLSSPASSPPGGPGKPMGSTLPDSPRPATPSVARHGGQHTVLSRSPREASHFSPVLRGTAEVEGCAASTEHNAQKRLCRNTSALGSSTGHGSVRRPSQECEPHSVNSNGPRPNRQGWKSIQFLPPTSPDWVSFGSSRRIAVLHGLPRSRGHSAELPKLRASKP